MSKISNDVAAVLNEAPAWVLSTCSDKPNAAPIFFKKIGEDGTLVFFDVFMKKNLENLEKNPNVAVVAINAQTMQGYQLKGKGEYTTDEAIVAAGNEISSKMNLKVKGAVIVHVEDIYVLTPGPDNGKRL